MAKNFPERSESYRLEHRFREVLVDEQIKIEEIKEIVVHRFQLGDVEDPILYAGEPLYKWQQSDQGQWVIEHAIEQPTWHRQADIYNYGFQFAITAKLKVEDITYFNLKWGV